MPETADVRIETISVGGEGVARHRGRTLLVPFTIPGERVRVILRPSRAGVFAADVDAVLEPSPHRVAAACRHFGPCGGCTWQHIAYPEQLRLKSALVTRLVRAVLPDAPEALPMIAGASVHAPWGYRHKVHFVFGRTGSGRRGELGMGHYMRASRRLLAVRECPVHDERGNALAFALRDSFVRAGIAADPDGPLKGIAVRVGVGTPEIMATLVVADPRDKRLRTATRRVLDSASAPSSFHVNWHPSPNAMIFGARTQRVAGPERMREVIDDVSYLVSPTAFFQTNVHAAADLVRLVRAAVPAGARVLDLYAGGGLFALPLAKAGHAVLAVEENRQAVADGEASLGLNRIPRERCTFIARTVEQALGMPSLHRGADVVVLDPPREGCSARVVDAVFGGVAPASAVYISCNPEALARDLLAIAAHGYAVQSLQPVDMFPHTAHVETVVRLGRV